MAQNVIINEVTYQAVPGVDIPKSGGGTARFVDPSIATLNSGSQLRNGVKGIGPDGTLYTGSMTEKSAQTYTPTTSDQTINANQYLAGAQTIKGDPNLTSANIKKDVTIFGIPGALSSATISQDPTTKILSIS